MTIGMVVYALVVSVLVGACARTLEEALRVAGRPTRFVWLAAMGLTVALVASVPFRTVPTGRAEVLPAAQGWAALGYPEAVSATESAWMADASASLGKALLWPIEAGAALGGPEVSLPLTLSWILMSVVLVGFGVATMTRYGMARRRWPVRTVAGTEVRVSPDVGPAVLGLFRPEIVLPSWILDAPTGEQRLVLLHERQHIETRDPLLLLIAATFVALVPWLPTLWWMHRRQRLAVEMDCDARVLRRGVTAGSYGSMLIDVADRRRMGHLVGSLAFAASSSTLERRLLALTREARGGVSPRSAGLGSLALLALLVACETPVPTAADIEAMDVARLEEGAARLGVLDPASGEVDYYVDWLEASAIEFHAMNADRITGIEVTRAADGERARVDVFTEAVAPERSVEPRDDPGATSPIATAPREDGPLLAIRPTAVPAAEAAVAAGAIRIAPRPATATPGDGPPPTGLATPLIIIDGARSSATTIAALRSEIVRIEVLRGEAAARLYPDADAAHGVIHVTTRAQQNSPTEAP